jgi:hypothetical protein
MPKRSSKPRKPGDVNQLAASILAQVTGEAPVEAEPAPESKPDDGKDPAAVALGRRGGLKGGAARAKSLTKKRRSAIAKKAAKARWGSR